MLVFVRKALFGALISFVFFAFCEGVLFFLSIPESIYEGDPRKLWWVKSNVEQNVVHVEEKQSFLVNTNSYGFRGEAIPEEGKWWLALGCSTTFGWGVEQESVWTELLSQKISIPIVNGGVPGWSTEQAKVGLERWVHLEPEVVLMSYLIRDAQYAQTSDRNTQATPWLINTRIFKVLTGNMRSTKKGDEKSKSVRRVSVEEYEQNLDDLKSLWPKSQVVYFAFPHLEDLKEYEQVLEERGALKIQRSEPKYFFAHDSIHLNKTGHLWLADQLHEALVKMGF